jgi:hypothetical protein
LSITNVLQEALARNKEEAQVLSWLENHVVTDVAYEMSESIVWSCLWDDARKISKEGMNDLDKKYGENEFDKGAEKVLRNNTTKPLSSKTGATLMNNKYWELVYNLNKMIERGCLVENYAIRKLQEQIITQVGDIEFTVLHGLEKVARWFLGILSLWQTTFNL